MNNGQKDGFSAMTGQLQLSKPNYTLKVRIICIMQFMEFLVQCL
jgi:hypothetical protein